MLRHLSTYIYLVVAVGLVCFVFIDKKIPGTKEREDSENVLFKLNPDDVTGLEITNVHNTFIFQKKDGHWEIKKPVDTLADDATVDTIVSQIAYAQPQRVIQVEGTPQDAENLKDWGLLPAPAERVVLHTHDKQYELLVGRKTAISDSVYARASGRRKEPVRIIPHAIKEALQKDLSDFRSHNVFDFDVATVTKVASRIANTATLPGQQCEIDLEDGRWSLRMPLVARASDADVQAMLRKILDVHAVDFINDDASNLSQYGLTSPAVTLSVTVKPAGSKTTEEIILQIGNPVPDKPDQVYAQKLKSNSVFTLTKAGVDDILKAMPAVRDRHVFPFDPNRAIGLSYSLAAQKGQIRKDNGLWNTVGEVPGRADVGQATDVLAKLSQIETTPTLVDSASDLKPFGLDKPQGKITIQSAEFKPEPSLTLLIGKAVNKMLYVRNSGEPFIYTIPERTLDFLPASNLAWRDARAIDLQLKDVTGLTVAAGSTPAVTLSRSSGGTWTAVNMKDRMVDSLKADTQASLLCQLQAKSWLGPALPAYGLQKPPLTLSIQTEGKTSTVLHIGAPLADGGHAAQVEGQPTVFEISDADFGILNTSSLQLLPSVLSGTNAPPVAPVPGTNSPASNVPVKK